MRQTSLQVYAELQPELGERQRIVYDAFRRFGPATDMEIVKILGVSDSNFIRPRRNELFKAGLIKEFPKRKDRVTNRLAIVWGV